MGEFLTTLGGWGIPASILTAFAIAFLIIQIIGELVEVAGKSVPIFFKVRKYFIIKKKKAEAREQQYQDMCITMTEIRDQQARVEALLNNVNEHYNSDNITKRDKWMLDVNSTMHWCKKRAEVYDASVEELNAVVATVKCQQQDLILNNQMTSEVYKQMTRTQILDFAHKLINARKADKPVIFSREEFRKIRKSYEKYEEFLNAFGGTNGEVDDAMKIVRDAEAGNLPNIEFLEDTRD